MCDGVGRNENGARRPRGITWGSEPFPSKRAPTPPCAIRRTRGCRMRHHGLAAASSRAAARYAGALHGWSGCCHPGTPRSCCWRCDPSGRPGARRPGCSRRSGLRSGRRPSGGCSGPHRPKRASRPSTSVGADAGRCDARQVTGVGQLHRVVVVVVAVRHGDVQVAAAAAIQLGLHVVAEQAQIPVTGAALEQVHQRFGLGTAEHRILLRQVRTGRPSVMPVSAR